MNIFKRTYTMRRYDKKVWSGGTSTAPYTDSTVLLNVQPQGGTTQQSSDGQWPVRVLKVFSDKELLTTDPDKGLDADRILYKGVWYECKSSFHWQNTILSHYECEFEAVSEEEGDADDPE